MTAIFPARESDLPLHTQLPAVYSLSQASVCLVPGVKMLAVAPCLSATYKTVSLSSLSGINTTTPPASDIAALCLSPWPAALHPGRDSVPIALLGLSTATILDS